MGVSRAAAAARAVLLFLGAAGTRTLAVGPTGTAHPSVVGAEARAVTGGVRGAHAAASDAHGVHSRRVRGQHVPARVSTPPRRAAAAAGAPPPGWSCAFHNDTDYQSPHKQDIGMHQGIPTAAACCKLCGTTPRCFAAAWNGPTYKTCYLKAENAAPVRRAGTVSCKCAGTKPPPPPCSNATLPRQGRYSVAVAERSAAVGGGSVISKANGSSVFQYNFNTAAFPLPKADARPTHEREATAPHGAQGLQGLGGGGGGGTAATRSVGLVVRLQDEGLHPEWANAGALAMVHARVTPAGKLVADNVTAASVTWPGVRPPSRAAGEVWGTIDPRIAYRPSTGLHYLTWDNCTRNCVYRQTMLSTSPDPFNKSSWVTHGQVLAGADAQPITAGVSLLFRDGADSHADQGQANHQHGDGPRSPHLAFVGNSNTAAALLLAESTDGLSWKLTPNKTRRVFMGGREMCWDAGGVAAGPQPERLSTGDYLYIYNIDTRSYTLPLGRCAVGWVRVAGRSISPRWRSIRFRLALRTYAPWGCIVRVVSQTKSRKIPTRKVLPLCFMTRPSWTAPTPP